jgi:hypothetical protein
MRNIASCAIAFLCVGLPLSAAFADTNTFIVPGNANLFGAGHTVPPAPAGGGGGVLPTAVGFPAANSNQFTFSVSGTIASDSITYWDAEGGPYPMNINSFGGISGVSSDNALYLMGVFLTSAAPGSTAPAILDFRSTAIGTNFDELSPAIGQSFYIGDGFNPVSGRQQRFNAPANATRLFLGVMDAYGFSGYTGAYSDNSGSFSVQVVRDVVQPPNLSVDLYAGLMLTGTVGSNYLVQYSTTLAPNTWTNLTNITLPSSPYFFLDLTAPARGARFYRVNTVP